MKPDLVKLAEQFEQYPMQDGRDVWRSYCPFHSPVGDRSMIYARDHEGWYFKCWKCGANGRDENEWRRWWAFKEQPHPVQNLASKADSADTP